LNKLNENHKNEQFIGKICFKISCGGIDLQIVLLSTAASFPAVGGFGPPVLALAFSVSPSPPPNIWFMPKPAAEGAAPVVVTASADPPSMPILSADVASPLTLTTAAVLGEKIINFCGTLLFLIKLILISGTEYF
jgi:hypothetical protein